MICHRTTWKTIGGAVICCWIALCLASCGGDATPPVNSQPALSGDPGFELDYDRLSGPLNALETSDRDTVRDTIQLIRKGEHTLALNRLTALKQKNPENSSVRILASYALLQAGNLAGAFQEAETAHDIKDGNAGYRCWFLAKVALLTGDRATVERELAHLRGSGGMVAEAQEIEKALAPR